jgi:hypothetical protein
VVEFPLVLEGDEAKESQGMEDVEPSNGAPGYQENVYDAAAGNKGHHVGQCDGLDAAGMRVPSVGDTEGAFHSE